MSTILVVDDDPGVLSAFESLLRAQGHAVITAGRADAALPLIESHPPDLLVMDIRMPGMTGLEAIQRVKAIAPKLPVIIMTGYATMETAVEATKLGAYDYQVKPLEPESMLRSIHGALECVRLMRGEVAMDAEAEAIPARDTLIGHSAALREIFKSIGRVAPTDATVLIRGETGTGKELVARAIYQHSRRFDQPLVVVNCAAIPETLLESELFGHERGAFTGASHQRVGKFEQASGGTLFLDEVGDMPWAIQAKLLRVLQDGVIEPLGGGQPRQVNVRILAATNRNLEAAIDEGTFREDLFHRLRVFSLHLPPLRERREDIPRLARYFLQVYAGELGYEIPVLSDDACALLCSQDWPGNVRDLQHTLRRALISTGGYPLTPDDIRTAIDSRRPGQAAGLPPALDEAFRALAEQALAEQALAQDAPAGLSLYETFTGAAEKALLAAALAATGGNRTHAAKRLGIPRPTFKSRMDKHLIDGPDRGDPDAG